MLPILRNVLAVVVGTFVGGSVNMLIINMSGSIFPPPGGMDPMDVESIAAHAHLFEWGHYLMPFLAHALGTLVGAFLAALIAASQKMKLALAIGAFFLIGGIIMAQMLWGAMPVWYIALDLLLAYFPAAYIGGKIGGA